MRSRSKPISDMDIKELTPAQKAKADKVAKLLDELKKSGVHIMCVDGGGGGSLSFARVPKSDRLAFGEEVIAGACSEYYDQLKECVYEPLPSTNIDILCP